MQATLNTEEPEKFFSHFLKRARTFFLLSSLDVLEIKDSCGESVHELREVRSPWESCSRLEQARNFTKRQCLRPLSVCLSQ